eukprot:10244946-Karenia_brevis.AAC.1
MPAALDFAITSPHRLSMIGRSSSRIGAAATEYERFKRGYMGTGTDCAAQGMSFIPMVGEPSGGWGASAICTFKSFAKTQASRENDDPDKVLASQLQ